MMRADWLGSILVALLVCSMSSSQSLVTAQTVDSSLQGIRGAIVQATGIPDATLDLKVKAKIFIISRINSAMNETNHGTRNSEASRIATVVAKTIADNAAYRNIHTIRVLYVATPKLGGAEKIIDSIDFRRDPSGIFQFHAT